MYEYKRKINRIEQEPEARTVHSLLFNSKPNLLLGKINIKRNLAVRPIHETIYRQ